MEVKHGRIPPGPQEEYGTTENLLDWMGRQFKILGDIYKASVYGTSVYAIRDVEFAHHVPVENWQNYVVTRDVSGMALEVVLRFILGDDYEQVGFHFDLLSEETARNMAFARSFRALGNSILQVIDRRRKNPAPLTLWACSCGRATRRAAN